jgi:esterase/lipase superfamily enzyme
LTGAALGGLIAGNWRGAALGALAGGLTAATTTYAAARAQEADDERRRQLIANDLSHDSSEMQRAVFVARQADNCYGDAYAQLVAEVRRGTISKPEAPQHFAEIDQGEHEVASILAEYGKKSMAGAEQYRAAFDQEAQRLNTTPTQLLADASSRAPLSSQNASAPAPRTTTHVSQNTRQLAQSYNRLNRQVSEINQEQSAIEHTAANRNATDALKLEVSEIPHNPNEDGGYTCRTEEGLCPAPISPVNSQCECVRGKDLVAGIITKGGIPAYSLIIKGNHTVVPVFFGTDRTHPVNGHGVSEYTANRNREITYGYANVTIPAVHMMGRVEEPTFWHFEFSEDPGRHIVVGEITPLDHNAFFAAINSRVNVTGPKRAFVFIHGYDTSFDDALRRTAQIAYDLKYPGPPILFSWPSLAGALTYPYDASNAAWAVSDLEKFLLDVAANSAAAEIDVIAHSMGNQVLISALHDLAMRTPPMRLREIVLAAPDIDADIFSRAIPAILGEATRVTLYVSSHDAALQASKRFNGYNRAGDSSEGLVIIPGMDTVDASAVDTSFIGHSYYSHGSVLTDIYNLFVNNTPPNLRYGISKVLTSDYREYFKFVPQ